MCVLDDRIRLNRAVSPLWKTVDALPCFVELSFVPPESSKAPTPVFHISPRICGHSAHPWIGLTLSSQMGYSAALKAKNSTDDQGKNDQKS